MTSRERHKCGPSCIHLVHPETGRSRTYWRQAGTGRWLKSDITSLAPRELWPTLEALWLDKNGPA